MTSAAREKKKKYDKEYQQTAAGAAAFARYSASPKGRVASRRYLTSDKGKAARAMQDVRDLALSSENNHERLSASDIDMILAKEIDGKPTTDFEIADYLGRTRNAIVSARRYYLARIAKRKEQ